MSQFENLIVENFPFSGQEQLSNLFKVSENSKDFESDPSVSASCEKLDCESFYSELSKEKIQIHQLEIEKETWRIESIKNGLKVKEYEKSIEELKNKLARLSYEKSPGYSKDPAYISIQKTEFAEINYNRLMLEKEVSKLKQLLADKDAEIQSLEIELTGSGKNLPVCVTPGHSRRTSALAKLDSNSMNYLRSEEKTVEKQDLQRRLHESLKINDGLTNQIKELQDKLRNSEGDKAKFSPETCYSAKKNSRASSISNFTQLKKSETEQDLELYVKKYKEALNEIEKLENLNKGNQQNTEKLHQIIMGKKNKIKKLNESQISCQASIKSLENQLNSIKSLKESEVERSHTEIINLKRALDLVHCEKEQLETKCRSTEDLKLKLSTVVQSWETCKNSENKLTEELNKLKLTFSTQETQLASSNSRLGQLEFLYQNLETNHSTTLKSLHDKEAALLTALEKNSKFSTKLQKAKQKTLKYKNGTQNNYNDFKDMARNYISEKNHREKLAEQNSELRFVIKSLEDAKDKLLMKNDELAHSKSELANRLSLLEQSAFEKLSTFNAVREGQEKSVNEITTLRLELKKKNEDYIMAKAETRKVLTDLGEVTTKLKKSQDQEDFLQKVLKNSESEIKRLSDKLVYSQSQAEERDQKIMTLNAELGSYKNQLNVFTTDIKKLENGYRLLNLENYSLQSKIEELDKIRLEPGNEATIKEEYFKLVRAYQHLNEELSAMRASLAQSKGESNESLKMTQKDQVLVEAHLERLQIKLEGVLDEKLSLERKTEFLELEKNELEKTVAKLRDEVEFKDRKNVCGDKYLKEIQRYKSEIRRMENEQDALKRELNIALGKVNSAQKWAKSVEEGVNLR